MLQLIITLEDTNPLESLDTASGSWKLFLKKNNQVDKISVKYFGQDAMVENLVEAIEELLEKNKRIN